MRLASILFAPAALGIASVLAAAGCSGTSSPSSLGCPLDRACYVVSSSGECSIDPASVCVAGAWQCGPRGTLGSGCLPDGGIAPPPPVDAGGGGCVLDTLSPPLACTTSATCTPYGGTCEFPEFNGPGQCVCGGQDSGTGPDGCVGPGCGVCTLPSFTITCGGPGDGTTCAPYDAECTGSGPYACACVAVDPPHGGLSN